jgi:hypothetical protein
MAAHSEFNKHLDRLGLNYSTATAGITTVTAPNTTMEWKQILELERMAAAMGHELVFTAGALKIRPKDSTL